MSFSLKIDLRGIKVLQKKLEKLQATEVEVGFFPEDKYGPENDNLNVAAVAWMQERGAEDYPSRPFFTNTVRDSMTLFHVGKAMRAAVAEAMKPRGNIEKCVLHAGDILKDEVQVSIEDYPGSNSLSWAAFKKKNDPLSYTDKMLHSVKVKIK